MHRGESLVVGTVDEVKNHPEVKKAYLGEDDEEDDKTEAAV